MSKLDNLLEEIRGPLTEGTVLKDKVAIDRMLKLSPQIVVAAKKRGYQVLHKTVEWPEDDDWNVERVEARVSIKGKDGDYDGFVDDVRQLVKQIIKGKGEKRVRSRPDSQARVVDYAYSRPKGLHVMVHFNIHVGTGTVAVTINEVIPTERY